MASMLYFTAGWCPPCKQASPIVEQLKAEGWDITKIDVDKERALADKWQVQAMPTFLILDSEGNAVRRIIGLKSKDTLESELKLAL